MIHTCRTLAFAGLFFALPSFAHAQVGGDTGVKKEPDVAALQAEIETLKRNNAMLREDYSKVVKRADNLEELLKKFLHEMENLKRNVGPDLFKDRVAKSPPVPSGRVLLANHYMDEMVFYINDKRWVVPAQSTMLVEDVPAGVFSYRVTNARFGERLNNPAATLVAGQTYTLTVR